MMTVLSVGCSSNISCSVHRSVLAMALGGALAIGWFSIASLQLYEHKRNTYMVKDRQVYRWSFW